MDTSLQNTLALLRWQQDQQLATELTGLLWVGLLVFALFWIMSNARRRRKEQEQARNPAWMRCPHCRAAVMQETERPQ